MGKHHTLASLGLILAAGCAAGCAAPRDPPVGEGIDPIQGGSADRRDHAVVGLALLDEVGFVRRTCSGTLIAPNLVLTAQHCVADTAPFVDCKSSVFGPAVDAARLRVTTSTSMWESDGDWIPATEVITPPGGPTVCGRDVALVVLSESVDARRATPIPPRLDALPRREEGYAAVGYGVTRANADDAGLRRRREALHVVCVGEGCGSRQVADDEWRGDHGICNGDSGGPALDAQGLLIGVTSRGPVACDDPIYGALLPHAAWLRDEGLRAADQGDYAPPGWTLSAHLPPFTVSGGASTGCSVSGAGTGGGAAWIWGTLAGLAVLRRRRRR